MTIKTSRTCFNKNILTIHGKSIQKLNKKKIYTCIIKIKETKKKKKKKVKKEPRLAWTFSSS